MNRPLRGEFRLRGDKSLSHRALMFAALARGKSQINNLSDGADVASTAAVLQSLGNGIAVKNECTEVDGVGLESFRGPEGQLYCGNSGTTLRLMLGILAGSQLTCILAGDHSLNRRPVRRVSAPLTLMGAEIETGDKSDHPPVRVVGKRLQGINYRSPIASAQVKSAVLLAALHAEGPTCYSEPELSRDHTERWLEHAGAQISVGSDAIVLAPGPALSNFAYTVPGDISTATFFIVAAAIIANSEITVREVLLNPSRLGAITLLRRMNADIVLSDVRDVRGEPVGNLTVSASNLVGCDSAGIATSAFIDEVPALAVAAMFAHGTTRFRGIQELRVKESDRAQAIVDLATAFGCRATLDADDIVIEGGLPQPLRAADPHSDHRMAMAIEICSLACGLGVAGEYADCVAISAPEFYPMLRTLQ